MSDAKLHVMDHPLILHKISMLRSKEPFDRCNGSRPR